MIWNKSNIAFKIDNSDSKHDKIEIVILDINMPILDGFQTSEHLFTLN